MSEWECNWCGDSKCQCGPRVDAIRATLREREAELAEAKKFNELYCRLHDHARAFAHRTLNIYDGMKPEWMGQPVPVVVSQIIEIAESTVARLREALEDAIQSVRGPVHYSPFPVYMPQIGVEFVKRWEEALSPSPSANSGEKPWTQEEIDSAKKRASVTVANFRIDPPGFSELELLRELETALRAWRYAQLWNAQDLRRANDAMDKLDALRKSDAPGEE